MSRKKTITIIITLFVVISILAVFIHFRKTIVLGDQVWSGEISLDHDVVITGNLLIKPGTKITMVAHTDTSSQGYEVAPDGFNDLDPTRKKSYEQQHVSIDVLGKLTAMGTAQQPIVFTSNAANPGWADWTGFYVEGDNSILDYVFLSHARHGLALGGKNMTVTNSRFEHALWGCISAGTSESVISNNYINDCGHEAVDNQLGGSLTILNNTMNNSHASIVVFEKENPIIIKENRLARDITNELRDSSNIIMENNIIDPALECDHDWVYENYVIPCLGTDPYLTE